MIDNFLAKLELHILTHVFKTAVFSLLGLQQNGAILSRPHASRHLAINLASWYSIHMVKRLLHAWVSHKLPIHGLHPLASATDDFSGRASEGSLIVTAAYMVGLWAAVLAPATLIVHFLGRVWARLPGAHPIGSTHDPAVTMLVLVSESANSAVWRNLLVMNRLTVSHVSLDVLVGYGRGTMLLVSFGIGVLSKRCWCLRGVEHRILRLDMLMRCGLTHLWTSLIERDWILISDRTIVNRNCLLSSIHWSIHVILLGTIIMITASLAWSFRGLRKSWSAIWTWISFHFLSL